MEGAVDFNATLALYRSKAFSKDYPRKAALDTVVVGARWPGERVKEAHPESSDVCLRCGNAAETDLHVLWRSPCNDNIDDDTIKQTDKYTDRAVVEHVAMPCLWLRGIVPSYLTAVSKDDIPTT